MSGFTMTGGDDGVGVRAFGRPTPPPATFARAEGRVLALAGRLHYRDDQRGRLTDAVPARLREAARTDDAALALAVYLQDGPDGLIRLEGEFALAVGDARAGCLIGVRDPMGTHPLYWTAAGGRVALSTGVFPLVDQLPTRTLDRAYLADFLMMPWPSDELPGDHTTYEGVRRVPAGGTVRLDTRTGRADRKTHWNWADRIVDPGTDRLEEIGDRYGELFRGAVRERMRGRVGSHASGGLDSTAVALTARDWAAAGGAGTPIHTLSLVYDRLPNLCGERAYVEASLRDQPGFVRHDLAGDDHLAYADLDGDAMPHDQPVPGLCRMSMNGATVAAAAGLGLDTLLTGHGGDDLLDVGPPLHLADLVRRGRLRAAWAEAVRWAGANNSSPWKSLYVWGLKEAGVSWLGRAFGARLLGGYAGWVGQTQWSIAPWVRPDFARRSDLRGVAAGNARRMYPCGQSVSLSRLLTVVASRVGDAQGRVLTATNGVTLTHPFLDPRVVRFGLGMSTRVRPDPGAPKPVLLRAMGGQLPAALTTRRRKGDFNELVYVGLSRNRGSIEALIRTAPREVDELFDTDALIHCLRQAALGVGRGVDGMLRLDVSLALIRWLTMESRWRQQQRDQPTADAPASITPAGGRRESFALVARHPNRSGGAVPAGASCGGTS